MLSRGPRVFLLVGIVVSAVLVVKHVSEEQGAFVLQQDSLSAAVDRDLGLKSPNESPAADKQGVDIDEAAADWRRKAKAAALHALKLDRVRRWDEDQAHEIATEEHGWLRLAENARSKAEKLDASWKKQKLEEKKLALLNQMVESQKEMKEIDALEKSLPSDGSDAAFAKSDSKAWNDLASSSATESTAASASADDDTPQPAAAPAVSAAAPSHPSQPHTQRARAAHSSSKAAAGAAAAAAPRRARGDSPAAPESIVDAVQSSLGDSVLRPSQLTSGGAGGAAAAKARRPALPGINAYSWWNPPAAPKKKAAAAAAAAAAAKEAAGLRTKPGKRQCHDLYDCMGSLFDSDSGKSKYAAHLSTGAARLESAMRADAAAAAARDGKAAHGGLLQSFATDRGVSASIVNQNPDQPILNILQTNTHTHSKRLPGVATNRWGGLSFWNRLLGPVSTKKAIKAPAAAAAAAHPAHAVKA